VGIGRQPESGQPLKASTSSIGNQTSGCSRVILERETPVMDADESARPLLPHLDAHLSKTTTHCTPQSPPRAGVSVTGAARALGREGVPGLRWEDNLRKNGFLKRRRRPKR
jgi:hypothetical protein